MNKPVTVKEVTMWHVMALLKLPREYMEELRKSKERIVEMLKISNWELTLYHNWGKQCKLEFKMPIPNLKMLEKMNQNEK